MLAAAQRLRRREDFAATIRNGRRAGRGALVVHFLQSTIEPAPADQPSARAGFVVSAPSEPAAAGASTSAGAAAVPDAVAGTPETGPVGVRASGAAGMGASDTGASDPVDTGASETDAVAETGPAPAPVGADGAGATRDGDPVKTAAAAPEDLVPARAGFVVSKAVGNAVVRNLVKRRLRHLIRPYLDDLPPASMIVVRALPASATARYEDLGRDLETALTAARRPRNREARR